MTFQIWPDRALTFLHDVARCLALASQGLLRLEPDGSLGVRSLEALARYTCCSTAGLDPADEQVTLSRGFIVDLLGRGGSLGAVDDTLRLTATAHEWLAQPAHLQLEQLRQTWFLALDLGWRWLPADHRKRQLDGHWRYILLLAMAEVANLPTTCWIPMADLLARLEAQDALVPGGVAQNLPRARHSARERAHKILVALFQQILPCLGLIETHSRGEEGLHLRPTAEGAAWLHAALTRARLFAPDAASDCAAVELTIPAPLPRFLPAAEPPLAVGSDLQMAVPLSAPTLCTFEIAHLAEFLSPGPPACYRLTRDSLRRAIGWGYPVADVLFLLVSLTGGRLPRPVVDQITAWQEEMVVITCDLGYRLHLAAPEILTALRWRDPFRQRTQPFASGQDVWVSEAQSPELFRYLRRVGYVLEGAEVVQETSTSGERRVRIPIHLHTPVPLPQLLVVLRTFQHLRRLVPGLADPELDDLDRAVTAALTPDDLAGAERLVESHLIFLRHHLGKGERRRAEEQDNGPVEGQGSGGVEDQADGEEACPASEDLTRRLQAAIDADSVVELTYADAKGKTVRRRVHPLHLETRWGRQYLLAFCELRQDERRFRLDRIVSIGD